MAGGRVRVCWVSELGACGGLEGVSCGMGEREMKEGL